jgi:hypothetical protein
MVGVAAIFIEETRRYSNLSTSLEASEGRKKDNISSVCRNRCSRRKKRSSLICVETGVETATYPSVFLEISTSHVALFLRARGIC